MSKFPVYCLFAACGLYALYVLYFTPRLDRLLARCRLSRQTAAVKAFAQELDLAAAAHRKTLEAARLELSAQLNRMDELRPEGLRRATPQASEPAPHITPEQTPTRKP